MPYRITKKFHIAAWTCAVACWCAGPAAAATVETDLSLGAGYRSGELNWNIAGTLAGTSPNVLSELKWHDLQIADINAEAELRVGQHIMLRSRGAYGEIVDGKNQDSDYEGNNRTLEFSRSSNKGGGRIAEGSLGLGYRFWWLDSSVGRYARVIPQIGYAWRGQYLNISDGRQVIPASEAGPIDNLDSSYDAEWRGPWLGLAVDMDAGNRTRLMLEFEYHLADYRAEANWNLRDDWAHPVSFIHETSGTGVVAAVEIIEELSKRWSLSARLESQNFVGDPGIDIINSITQSGAVQQLSTRLNKVEWKSVAANLAITLRF